MGYFYNHVIYTSLSYLPTCPLLFCPTYQAMLSIPLLCSIYQVSLGVLLSSQSSCLLSLYLGLGLCLGAGACMATLVGTLEINKNFTGEQGF